MKSPKLLSGDYLSFIPISRNSLDWWERAKSNGYSVFTHCEVTFVSKSVLIEKSKGEKLHKTFDTNVGVWQAKPAMLSKHWTNEHSGEKEKNYRVNVGSYQTANGLLFIDDLIDWAYRRKTKEQVRSAFDIIIALQEGRIVLD